MTKSQEKETENVTDFIALELLRILKGSYMGYKIEICYKENAEERFVKYEYGKDVEIR